MKIKKIFGKHVWEYPAEGLEKKRVEYVKMGDAEIPLAEYSALEEIFFPLDLTPEDFLVEDGERIWSNELVFDIRRGHVYRLHLDYIDAAISNETAAQLRELKWFSMVGNDLSTVPEFIKKFSKLKHLDLQCNNISTLPDWIDSLQNLHVLNVRGNELDHVPHAVYELPSLKIFEIRGNPIQQKDPLIEKLREKGVYIAGF